MRYGNMEIQRRRCTEEYSVLVWLDMRTECACVIRQGHKEPLCRSRSIPISFFSARSRALSLHLYDADFAILTIELDVECNHGQVIRNISPMFAVASRRGHKKHSSFSRSRHGGPGFHKVPFNVTSILISR